uniref:Uncharacterized protein n=1 Tax=Anguilla anguilla TaxID=7936 RepID=A0A0E9TLE6_ANGAN
MFLQRSRDAAKLSHIRVGRERKMWLPSHRGRLCGYRGGGTMQAVGTNVSQAQSAVTGAALRLENDRLRH